jgi:hypothetical protein
MLGLVSLQHVLNPHSTLEKLVFLVDNALTHTHYLTATISFSALAILVILRRFKLMFKQYWWIYRIPEVLLVVVVSTSGFQSFPALPIIKLTYWQFSVINSTGMMMVLTSWVTYR